MTDVDVPPRPARSVRRRLVSYGLIALAAIVLTMALRNVDWPGVGDALRHLYWWQLVILLLVLVLRQFANSMPLALLVPGLGVRRALVNDTAANLVMYAAPPPADLVMRTSLFRTWGVDLARGMTGVTLNTVVFYIVRFSAPIFGLLLLTLSGHVRPVHLRALPTVLVSAALVAALLLILRGDGPASWLGRTVGGIARRFRPQVDPASWSRSLIDLRHSSVDIVRRAMAPSLLLVFAMLLADSIIVLLCVRFVGVDASVLPTALVIGCYFLVYPLTLFPIQGLGLVEASMISLLVHVGGADLEPTLLAALIVWRVVTILVPLAVGVPTVIATRPRRSVSATHPQPEEDLAA